SATLGLSDVDVAFERIAHVGGKGSAGEKLRLLHALLTRATDDEQRFLARLVIGELRQGALRGLVLEAVAQAAGIPSEAVRRAVTAAGDLPSVARVALVEGGAGLSRLAIQLFRPVLPMLAESAEDAAEALERLGRAALEFKLDGARVQVHKSGEEVRVYSRRLNEVTVAVPAFLDAALARGHEGIMAKALDAPYEAGNRGQRWLKVKPAQTLDLVVLAAEWGHGRRRGWLSNLHLGARDPEHGGFVMLGKTFKGMTDAMLEWQTKRLLELEIGRDAQTVHVRPELVV